MSEPPTRDRGAPAKSSVATDATDPTERTAMTTYQLAVIPGDGVGTEVIPEGLKVLRRAGEVTGSFDIATRDFPWSCQWYLEHGAMMPSDGVDQLRDSDAVYLGAVGFPGVPDHI